MKIGLVDVDSKIPNLALMKISAYHKQLGDEVKFYDPMFDKPDLIYASKIFDFTADYNYFPSDVPILKGGTGYDLTTVLPDDIENITPDYSLYNTEFALGFNMRGCDNQCPYCVVWKKEGCSKVVGDIYDFWQGQKHIMILDNNLTSLPTHFELITKQLIKEKLYVDFCQGLDIRLMTSDMASLLSKVKVWKQFRFAFDSMEVESSVIRGIRVLDQNGVKPHKQMFYVLIGFNTTMEQDIYRVELLRSLGVDPFVMPFNKKNCYQANFARWVDNKATFYKYSWAEYECTKRDSDKTTICRECEAEKKKYIRETSRGRYRCQA